MTVLRNVCLIGDARTRLAQLPPAMADCVITSPPYFLLRNYGMPGQLGAEPDVGSWTRNLLSVMREVGRVLKPTGSLWLNLGDSFSRHARYGAARKSLALAPERLLLGLAEDGWIVRNKVVWAKTNPLPSSVRDRLTCTWEPLYLLTRSANYFFDLDAIRVAHRSSPRLRRRGRWPRSPASPPAWAGPLAGNQSGLGRLKAAGRVGHRLGRNPGDVWPLAASNYRGAHFATFPERLVERPLLASCPARVCVACGQAWRQERQRRLGRVALSTVLAPVCGCRALSQPGLVLDPFFGSGTVGVVAEQHGRDWLGIELNPAFVVLAEQRLARRRQAADRAA